MHIESQNEMLLRALERRPMTAMDILQECGIARASARILDLRERGVRIESETIEVKNRHGKKCRVARYRLLSTQTELALGNAA